MMKHCWILAVMVVAFPGQTWAAEQGEFCNDQIVCDTGNCVDDVCCDTICTAPCEACSAEEKGHGVDGTCELVVAGTVCVASFCEPTGFAFVPADTCDAGGNCVDGGSAQSCYASDGVCAKDACHNEDGCQVIIMPDGLDCGGGEVCVDGVCGGEPMGGFAGSSGEGGAGGMGGSTGTGFGGAGDPVEGGSTNVNASCDCRAGAASGGGAPALGWLLALAAVVWRRGKKYRSR